MGARPKLIGALTTRAGFATVADLLATAALLFPSGPKQGVGNSPPGPLPRGPGVFASRSGRLPVQGGDQLFQDAAHGGGVDRPVVGLLEGVQEGEPVVVVPAAGAGLDPLVGLLRA